MSAGDERRKQALLAGPVRRVQRRLNQELWARSLVGPAWIGAGAVAAYRLLVRSHVWVALGVGMCAVVVAAAIRMRRIAVSEQTAAALADRAAGAGGLLLTRLEVPVGAWELSLNEQVRKVRPPEVALAEPVMKTLAALAFLLVALWIPLPPPVFHPPSAAAQSELSQLTAKAAALAKEQPLGTAVEQELARLQREATSAQFTPADWAAADAVKGTLDAQAQAAAEKLARAQQAAKALEQSLESGTASEAEQREREELEQALTELGDQGDGQSEDGSGDQQSAQGGKDGAGGDQSASADKSGAGDKTGGDQGAGADKNGGNKNGDKAGGDKTAGADKNGGSKSGDKAGGDKTAGADKNGGNKNGGQKSGSNQTGGNGSRSQQARAASQGGKRDVSELRKALENRQRALDQAFSGRPQPGAGSKSATASSTSGQSNGASGQSGEGMPGVSEGGSSKRLRFGDPAPMAPEKLGFEALPKGQGGEGRELWGLKAADPKPGTDAPRGGATGEVATGEQAPGHGTAALLPRNRALVRRYFEAASQPPTR